MKEGSFIHKAPIFKNERTTFERIEKFISKHYFTDCNLRGRLYGKSSSVRVKHYDFGSQDVSFAEAVEKLSTEGSVVQKGFSFGPTWSTHWFQVDIDIPKDFAGDIVLRFDANCEALIWCIDGRPVQGLSPDFGRTNFRLPSCPTVHRVFVEASANCRIGDGNGDMIGPAKLNKTFRLDLVEITEFNQTVYDLLMDFDILLQMAQLLPKESTRRYQALHTANSMINVLVASNFSLDSQKECHNYAKNFFSQRNGVGQMTLYAVGNCHIDTAWLWRYDETKRKCARSWASTLLLMESYKKMTFAVSQAQQLVWLRERYPMLYEDMQDRCTDKRLVGVGGAWVEFDGNLPSGESMIRQLLYGQREFKKIFGRFSEIFWLPDTFGYSAQMPQILKHCGMSYFVTQKMSWSLVNKFPHHSFKWIGMDGSSVLAHFPPHHYASQITVQECLESASNFSEKGRSNIALMLYGHGDGGGGPDEHMLERAERLADCDGVPRVLLATPEEFFTQLELDESNLCTWVGELYLELHNATYTTQAMIKKMNRKLESILRDQEFIQAVQLLQTGKGRKFSMEWKKLLLNQFHDVLPGTCIKEAVHDALLIYRQLLHELTADGDQILKVVDEEEGTVETSPMKWVLNSCGWPRTLFHNKRFLDVPAFSLTPLNELKSLKIKPGKQNLASECGDEFILENEFFFAKINKAGQVVSFVVKAGKDSAKENLLERFEAIAESEVANQFAVFDDIPLYWDAWDVMDYHLETKKIISEGSSAALFENSPVFASIRVNIPISEDSNLVQDISIRADLPYLTFDVNVSWHESHKFLKVEFPVSINSEFASYDIQFGYVHRPTHRNTSWDAAKYEVCGHKWMALAEFDRGAALINDCKYGHSCDRNILRLSLLRSSKSPDDTADMGDHCFSYAFYAFRGSMQHPLNHPKLSVMRAAYEFNNPVRFIDGWNGEKFSNIFSVVGSEGVIIDTIKQCEDDRNALVLRLFECFGGGTTARLLLNHPRIVSVDSADGLERVIANLPIEPPSEQSSTSSDSVILHFRAFELKTLLVRLFAL